MTTQSTARKDTAIIGLADTLDEKLKQQRADPYRLRDTTHSKCCARSDHLPPKAGGRLRKNDAENPRCLIGLGEGREGVWAQKPQFLEALSPNPSQRLRSELPPPTQAGGKAVPASARAGAVDGDKTKKEKLLMPVGLVNLGATCYLNAQLQCLYHQLPFRRAILQAPLDAIADSKHRQIMESLQLIFGHMYAGTAAAHNIADFANLLDLNTSEQQDPSEFNSLFMALLEKCMTSSEGARSPLADLFRIGVELATTCGTCRKDSARPDPSFELRLNLKTSEGEPLASVTRCLQEYLRGEEMTGDNRYYCEQCNMKRDAKREQRLSSLPPFLNLQLVRFEFNPEEGRKRKVRTGLKIEESIKVPVYRKVEGGAVVREEHDYDVIAVMHHKGSAASSGHYIAQVFDPCTKRWFLMDDHKVTVSSPPYGHGSEKKAVIEEPPKAKEVPAQPVAVAPPAPVADFAPKTSPAPAPSGIGSFVEDKRSSKLKRELKGLALDPPPAKRESILSETPAAAATVVPEKEKGARKGKNKEKVPEPKSDTEEKAGGSDRVRGNEDAYMLVYCKRGYMQGQDLQTVLPPHVETAVRVTGEVEMADQAAYENDKDKLLSEIAARKQAYERLFGKPDSRSFPHPSPAPSDKDIQNDDFFLVSAHWLRQWVVGWELEEAKHSKSGSSSTTPSNTSKAGDVPGGSGTGGGSSSNGAAHVVVDLASDREAYRVEDGDTSGGEAVSGDDSKAHVHAGADANQSQSKTEEHVAGDVQQPSSAMDVVDADEVHVIESNAASGGDKGGGGTARIPSASFDDKDLPKKASGVMKAIIKPHVYKEPISQKKLLCEHSKVHPANIRHFKVLSKPAYTALVEECGAPDVELSGASFQCHECIKQHFKAGDDKLTECRNFEALYAALETTDDSPDAQSLIVSKQWERAFKSYFKGVQSLLAGVGNQKTSIEEWIKGKPQAKAITEPRTRGVGWDIGGGPSELPPIDVGIRCVHNNVTPSRKLWKEVKGAAVEAFVGAFENAPLLTLDMICKECREQEDAQVGSRDAQRALKAEQYSNPLIKEVLLRKSKYPRSFWDFNHIAEYYLVDADWLSSWRDWTKKDTAENCPPYTSTKLLCGPHGKTLLPDKTIEVFCHIGSGQEPSASDFPTIEVVTCQEFAALKSMRAGGGLAMSADVEEQEVWDRCPTLSGGLLVPEFCRECAEEKTKSEESAKTHYEDKAIIVVQLKEGQAPPPESDGLTESGRPKRATRGGTKTMVTISSNRNIAFLKVKIGEQLPISVGSQVLFLRGKQICADHLLTLQEVGVKAGDTVYVKVDSELDLVDESYILQAAFAEGSIKIELPSMETGFRGSALMGGDGDSNANANGGSSMNGSAAGNRDSKCSEGVAGVDVATQGRDMTGDKALRATSDEIANDMQDIDSSTAISIEGGYVDAGREATHMAPILVDRSPVLHQSHASDAMQVDLTCPSPRRLSGASVSSDASVVVEEVHASGHVSVAPPTQKRKRSENGVDNADEPVVVGVTHNGAQPFVTHTQRPARDTVPVSKRRREESSAAPPVAGSRSSSRLSSKDKTNGEDDWIVQCNRCGEKISMQALICPQCHKVQ